MPKSANTLHTPDAADLQRNGRRRRQSDKRQRILNAAVRVFARRGFYNAKIAEIARAAAVADGTIYLYFKNKDDLLISLFDERMGSIIDEFRGEIAGLGNAADKVRHFIQMHFRLVKKDPDLATVIQLELRQSNKFIKEYHGSRFADYLNLIREIIVEGQMAGLFRRDVQPGVVKRALFGALDEMSTLWLISKNKKYELEDCAEQVARLFLGGLVKDRGAEE